MSMARRVQQSPAYLLHHRPFRDSSQLLDLISRDHGRLVLVSRGSRSSRSKIRGFLRPFMPLVVSWVQRTDLGTLTGADVNGAAIYLQGDALLSGFYVNELLLNFLHRHDPQPEIFDLYGQTLRALNGPPAIAPVLRQFEIELLRLLGYAMNFEHEAASDAPLDGQGHYEYRFEQGPVAVRRSDGDMVFSGAELKAIGAGRFADPDVLRAAGRLMHGVIAFHLGGKELKTRRVLVDLHRARIKAGSDRPGE